MPIAYYYLFFVTMSYLSLIGYVSTYVLTTYHRGIVINKIKWNYFNNFFSTDFLFLNNFVVALMMLRVIKCNLLIQ